MGAAHLQIQFHGEYPQALPSNERAKVDDFYAARDNAMPPLPWPSIAPPTTPDDDGPETGQSLHGRDQGVSGRSISETEALRDMRRDHWLTRLK
jgi:hypothetical protein